MKSYCCEKVTSYVVYVPTKETKMKNDRPVGLLQACWCPQSCTQRARATLEHLESASMRLNGNPGLQPSFIVLSAMVCQQSTSSS